MAVQGDAVKVWEEKYHMLLQNVDRRRSESPSAAPSPEDRGEDQWKVDRHYLKERYHGLQVRQPCLGLWICCADSARVEYTGLRHRRPGWNNVCIGSRRF